MKQISEKIVAALPAPAQGNKLHYFSGAKLAGKTAPPGFAVRVTSAGTKSFVLFHRHGGRQFLETLGRWDENAGGGSMTVGAAVIRAKERAAELDKAGTDPRPRRTRRLEDGAAADGAETVAQLIDEWADRMRKDRRDFRSLDYIVATLRRLVVPVIGKRSIYDLRRRDIKDMLDGVADNNGPVQADRVLSYLRAVFKWRAVDDDDLVPPFAPGMARTDPAERARHRTLSDEELCAIWKATDDGAPFSRFIRFLLLTGARRGEVAGLPWSEIVNGIWKLPASRNKVKVALDRPLSKAAMEQLVPNGRDLVFGFNKPGTMRDHKALLAASNTSGWVLHDLRRTARTMLARAGVQAEHAERCLGHKQDRIVETYDRHRYIPEMTRAYEMLATLVEQIVDPKENVTQLSRARG
jgi:integrase